MQLYTTTASGGREGNWKKRITISKFCETTFLLQYFWGQNKVEKVLHLQWKTEYILRIAAIDTELAMYALTLVNKCLYGIPDQDTFYDQTDYMEELNMTSIIESLTSLDSAEGMDSSLMQQVQLYNVALKQEDGEPVTEDEISYLDEDATESGLRTTLRAKADKGKRNKHFQERKSLR